ncbi:hypothetical protein VP01_67g4 [Puccinia sorghi]|uniref:Uncharacterized protein n=1 Tax=Puccinia sorghi TaxID=27349 RepID=A0A0L6UEH2_9BASI|nr:hypothetical protein VP01_67g4 [Puccinia sorghi]
MNVQLFSKLHRYTALLDRELPARFHQVGYILSCKKKVPITRGFRLRDTPEITKVNNLCFVNRRAHKFTFKVCTYPVTYSIIDSHALTIRSSFSCFITRWVLIFNYIIKINLSPNYHCVTSFLGISDLFKGLIIKYMVDCISSKFIIFKKKHSCFNETTMTSFDVRMEALFDPETLSIFTQKHTLSIQVKILLLMSEWCYTYQPFLFNPSWDIGQIPYMSCFKTANIPYKVVAVRPSPIAELNFSSACQRLLTSISNSNHNPLLVSPLPKFSRYQTLQKKLAQLPAVDMQHAPAKAIHTPHSLLENGWGNSRSFLGLSACQLQAVEQVFFAVKYMVLNGFISCLILPVYCLVFQDCGMNLFLSYLSIKGKLSFTPVNMFLRHCGLKYSNNLFPISSLLGKDSVIQESPSETSFCLSSWCIKESFVLFDLSLEGNIFIVLIVIFLRDLTPVFLYYPTDTLFHHTRNGWFDPDQCSPEAIVITVNKLVSFWERVTLLITHNIVSRRKSTLTDSFSRIQLKLIICQIGKKKKIKDALIFCYPQKRWLLMDVYQNQKIFCVQVTFDEVIKFDLGLTPNIIFFMITVGEFSIFTIFVQIILSFFIISNSEVQSKITPELDKRKIRKRKQEKRNDENNLHTMTNLSITCCGEWIVLGLNDRCVEVATSILVIQFYNLVPPSCISFTICYFFLHSHSSHHSIPTSTLPLDQSHSRMLYVLHSALSVLKGSCCVFISFIIFYCFLHSYYSHHSILTSTLHTLDHRCSCSSQSFKTSLCCSKEQEKEIEKKKKRHEGLMSLIPKENDGQWLETVDLSLSCGSFMQLLIFTGSLLRFHKTRIFETFWPQCQTKCKLSLTLEMSHLNGVFLLIFHAAIDDFLFGFLFYFLHFMKDTKHCLQFMVWMITLRSLLLLSRHCAAAYHRE